MAAVNVLDSGAENVVGAVPLHVLDVDLQLYCCCARPIQAAPRTGRGAGMYKLPSLRLAQRDTCALSSAVKISCTSTTRLETWGQPSRGVLTVHDQGRILRSAANVSRSDVPTTHPRSFSACVQRVGDSARCE